MKLTARLRGQSEVHPLDADLEMFNAAATRIEGLESALLLITRANKNWSFSLTEKEEDAIQFFINQAES